MLALCIQLNVSTQLWVCVSVRLPNHMWGMYTSRALIYSYTVVNLVLVLVYYGYIKQITACCVSFTILLILYIATHACTIPVALV